MDNEKIDAVLKLIAEIVRAPKSEITLDTKPVQEFDLDSLGMVEIILGLEDAFDIEISQEEAEKLQHCTVREMLDEIEKKSG